MATIDWDSTLPQDIEQSGYVESSIDNLLTTTMNEGPYKSRPKNTEAYQALKGTMVMSTAQRATFYTFYKSTIAWGSLAFNFPEPGNSSSTIETKISSFSFAPINGNEWRITLNLVVLVTT